MSQTAVSHYIAAHWSETICQSGKTPGEVILPHRFTVPTMGPTFRAFFYWDTYFSCLGLLRQGQEELAIDNANNFIHLCRTLGYIPNFNIQGHLNRSQLPVAALLYRDIFAVTKDREWLAEAYDALKIEYSYWMSMRMDPAVLDRLKAAFVLGQAAVVVIGLILLAYYPISRARAEETQRILALRRDSRVASEK